ncbi:MAG: polysaccharide deacetylase family protein [Bacteroidota bacterium]|nr:polysaccharide deacetylase family protein [Bacteroidota bacterium]
MSETRYILLSFDVEEFDIPLEYGQAISPDEQMQVGYNGLVETMNIIDRLNIEATFFTTANFASHYPEAVKTISQMHEIASHTFYHSHFATKDLANSKALLEAITGKTVAGLRMPRMQAANTNDVAKAGYTYDSSINPTWLPGRYNNLRLPRTIYNDKTILRLPSSVTPIFRIPLFWLSFKNFPYPIYRQWVKNTLKKDGYVCLYFHPWEFVELKKYNIPAYLKRGAGPTLQNKLKRLINDLKCEGEVISIQRYLRCVHKNW